MFIGAINSDVRQVLANTARVFNGRRVVVGCSGNFTSEAVISAHAAAAEIHSNDVSLYCCMFGRWLSGRPLDLAVAEPDFAWLEQYLVDDTSRLAAMMVLLDALEFEKQNNAHRVRMWKVYRAEFGRLVSETQERLAKTRIKVTSFFEGDVWDHYQRFAEDKAAVFCCYAPTYTGGYERLYRRLEQVFRWQPPQYELLDDERRAALLAWMQGRDYLWYDDRVIPGVPAVLKQASGRRRAVYLYSNLVQRTAVMQPAAIPGLPDLPLVDSSLEIQDTSRLTLLRIKSAQLAAFKEAFLSKRIDFALGTWPFALLIDGRIAGFVEFERPRWGSTGEVYMMADFDVICWVLQRQPAAHPAGYRIVGIPLAHTSGCAPVAGPAGTGECTCRRSLTPNPGQRPPTHAGAKPTKSLRSALTPPAL